MGFEVRQTELDEVVKFSPHARVTLGKLLDFTKPQFPHV